MTIQTADGQDTNAVAEAPEAPQAETRECNICHETKTLNNFYTETKKRADGTVYTIHRTTCKTCWRLRRNRNDQQRKAARRKPVNPDGRRGGIANKHTTSSTGYHFDKDTIHKLQRIARVLAREGWRSVGAVQGVDNKTLAAAGMYVGDLQILRKALGTGDPDLVHFIFDEPLTEAPPALDRKPGIRVVQHDPRAADEEVTKAQLVADLLDTGILDLPVQAEPTTPTDEPTPNGLYPLEHEVSDADLETAAEMIVQAKTRMAEVQAAVREYEDILANLRQQYDAAEKDKQAALDLLRRA